MIMMPFVVVVVVGTVLDRYWSFVVVVDCCCCSCRISVAIGTTSREHITYLVGREVRGVLSIVV